MKKGIDYIAVGVGAVIINPEGKLFLSKRGDKAWNERGKWEFPGGAMEFGESFEATIIREIQEEFDFVIEPQVQLEPFNHLIPEENQHWVALCFICKVISGIPRINEPDKSTAINWFTVDEAAQLDLTTASRHRIKQLNEKYSAGLPNLY